MAAVITPQPSSKKPDLLQLPFDQYSRQFMVAQLIGALRSGDKPLRIIDLGGHKGKTAEFLPADNITILDVYNESYPGYVKGDATKLTYKDDAFDVACSFDVFEHIPRGKRQAFLNEALRVSKYGVFLTMPVDTPEGDISGAEILLNDIHKRLYAEDHQWLKEHIDYHIPNDAEIVALVKGAGAEHLSFASNEVADWELLQTLIFIAAKNPHATLPVQGLNRWYNKNSKALEAQVSTGYRRIYFVTRKSQMLQTVTAAVPARSQSKAGRYVQVHEGTLRQSLVAMADIGKALGEVFAAKQAGDQRILELEALTKNAETRQTELQNELQNIRHSLSWRITQPLRTVMKQLRGWYRRVK